MAHPRVRGAGGRLIGVPVDPTPGSGGSAHDPSSSHPRGAVRGGHLPRGSPPTFVRPSRWEARLVERLVPAGPPHAALVLVSRLADGSRLWFAVAAVLALRPGLRRAAGEAVGAALLAAGATQVLHRAVRRPRPPADHPVRRALARQPATPSFPSSHAAVAVAFTTAVARRHPLLARALAPLAGTLAYGRVRLRVHWPSDVLGGAVLGLAAGRVAGPAATAAAAWAGSGPR